MKSVNFKSNLSIFIIWLFTISGMLGVLSDFQDWFLGYTPLYLFLALVIILLYFTQFNAGVILLLAITFFLGFVVEISATRFYFWEFDDRVVTIQNYLIWFGTAFIANMVYQYFKVGFKKIISAQANVSIVIFFSIFLFF